MLGLWTDKTAGENAKKPKTTDLVFRLDHNSKDKWGNAGNQGYLWPPMWWKSSKNLNPPSISLLELQGVCTTSRAIILNFGALHFQVRLLKVTLWIVLFWPYCSLHILLTCLCNVSTSMLGTMLHIRKTPMSTCRYCIALVIEFSDYIMAFLSIDQLIQVLY